MVDAPAGAGALRPRATTSATRRVPLDEAVRELVHERTGRRPRGPIRLLTHLRYFGYVFNPVSFYYCFDAADRRVETVVAEVNNTPWGERHCYVLDVAASARGSRWLRARSAKAMHVSPFHPMDARLPLGLRLPGERLAVHMALTARDAPRERTGVRRHAGARARADDAATLAATLLRFPLMTLQVIAAIHWQALRLWLKRVPVHDHPARRADASDTLTRPSMNKTARSNTASGLASLSAACRAPWRRRWPTARALERALLRRGSRGCSTAS